MLRPGVAGCTMNSALAARYCHFNGGALQQSAVAGQPDWDFNRAIVLYAYQSPLVEP